MFFRSALSRQRGGATGRWGFRSAPATQLRRTLEEHSRRAQRASALLQLAYFFPCFWMTQQALQWQTLTAVRHPDWLWPLAWVGWLNLDWQQVASGLTAAGVIGGLLGAVFSAQRWARGVAVLSLLEFLALVFSLGKIHHLMHGWLLLLGLLVWLPRGWQRPELLSRSGKHALLLTFTAAQLTVAVTYLLSGVGKLLGTAYELWQGELGLLDPQSFARYVASRLLETDERSLLGPVSIDYGVWLWPASVAIVYLQCGAVLCVLRPRLHRLLGAGLVGFHVLTSLTMCIDFTPAIVLCGLLYGVSPSAAPAGDGSRRQRWLAVLGELPLFGALARRSLGRASSAADRAR